MVRTRLTDLFEGRHDLTAPVPCQGGCRLSHIELKTKLPIATNVTVSSIRQTGPGRRADRIGRTGAPVARTIGDNQ